MNIRSITYFYDPYWPDFREAHRRAGSFIDAARPAFEEAGYEVQTVRLATVPFPLLPDASSVQTALRTAGSLEKAAMEQGYNYLSMGPAIPSAPWSYRAVPELLANTENIFLSGMMTTRELGVSLQAVRYCAEAIHQIAPLSPDGFANLRFAALANVGPNSPFFPAAYSTGNSPSFAIATESADLAVEAFTGAENLSDARERLVLAIETHARNLMETGERLARRFDLPFTGVDFSLAPFPEVSRSLGTALERLGVSAVGTPGSLAAAAILAEAVDRARFKRTGFSGLMLPVLEDARLAARAAEGWLTITDLLLYSAVCGTGLDTLALPGDVTVEQLQAILLDLAALSTRLEKPLTARLMPIPGMQAGDETHFDFAYFANSRVMEVKGSGLSGYFLGDGNFDLQARVK